MSTLSKTKERLELWGFSVCIVERFITGANKRKDAFGLGDLLACKEGRGVFLVQATSMKERNAHINKALAQPILRRWLDSGGRFLLVSWRGRMPKIEEIIWRDGELRIICGMVR